MATFLLV